VKAAADAFPAWSRTIPRERGRLLARIADALEGRVEELARAIALETGNALRTQARPEAKTTIDILRYFGGLGSELKGETIPLGEHVLSYTRRECSFQSPSCCGRSVSWPCSGNWLYRAAAQYGRASTCY
jgi:betaine-aldehyde dehydrogenase